MMPCNQTELPMVSVVVPCYNARQTLRRCLDGLLAQDYPRVEIIVVDDHSSDGTGELLNTVPGIRLITNTTNRGPANARNEAIQSAKGEILLLIDSDCLVEDKHLIEKHVAAHWESGAQVIGGGVQGIGCGMVAKADGYSHWFLNIPHSDNKVGTHLTSNNLSVAKDVFKTIGYFDEQLRTGEDTDFCERARKAGFTLGLQSDAVVKHHDREKLNDFLMCFYKVGLDRIPTRRTSRHRYWYLLPFGFFSSLVYWLPLGLLLSLQIVLAWFRYEPKVILYFPLICLGRLSMTAGIVRYFYLNRTQAQ